MYMRFFLLACGGLLWAACAGGCHSAPPPSSMPAYQTERFELSGAAGCPEGYPATLIEGHFITSDGGSFPVPWGAFMNGSWGSSSSGAWVVGDENQPAPDSLELAWYSYTEDKFYEGHFLLPQQRIHTLLKNGFLNLSYHVPDTYNSLNINVVPAGVVYVWLWGDSDEKVFIGRYQAREVAYDFARFKPNTNRVVLVRDEQAKLPAAVRQQIAAGTLSSRPWDAYFTPYPWQVAFSQPLTLHTFGIGYVNGESMTFPQLPDSAAYLPTLLRPGPKPLPKSLHLVLDAGYGRRRELYCKAFDEAQTRLAFQTLHAASPAQPISLYFETDEQVSKARLFVQNGQQRIELTKTLVELYEAQ